MLTSRLIVVVGLRLAGILKEVLLGQILPSYSLDLAGILEKDLLGPILPSHSLNNCSEILAFAQMKLKQKDHTKRDPRANF